MMPKVCASEQWKQIEVTDYLLKRTKRGEKMCVLENRFKCVSM